MSHHKLLQLAHSLGSDATDASDSFEDVAMLAAFVFHLLWTERAGNSLMFVGVALVALGVLQYLM